MSKVEGSPQVTMIVSILSHGLTENWEVVEVSTSESSSYSRSRLWPSGQRLQFAIEHCHVWLIYPSERVRFPSNCEWLSLQKGNQQEPNHPEYACLSRRNIMTCLILDSSWNFRMMWILWTCWFHGFYLKMYFAECIHHEFHLWKLTYFWQITIFSWQVKGLLHGHLCYSYVTNCQRVNHPGLITMEISCRVQALYWFKLVIIQYMGLCHFMLFHWITHSYNILQPKLVKPFQQYQPLVVYESYTSITTIPRPFRWLTGFLKRKTAISETCALMRQAPSQPPSQCCTGWWNNIQLKWLSFFEACAQASSNTTLNQGHGDILLKNAKGVVDGCCFFFKKPVSLKFIWRFPKS